jgi:hypothetical protein
MDSESSKIAAPGFPRNLESRDEYRLLANILQDWGIDTQGVKAAFLRLLQKLTSMENSHLTFKSRPGVSHSLRGGIRLTDHNTDRIVTLIDIIDDDPQSRWLSVCFYEDTITDDNGLGNPIPKGILGEDGYCFDLFAYDEVLLLYLEGKIDEAFKNVQNP